MKEKIVVLNSGGFDSVCLCHWVRDNYPDAELHSLHFEYGNRNRIMETHCAKKVCRKLEMISHNVKIPKITWTRSTLYGRKHSDETKKRVIASAEKLGWFDSVSDKAIKAKKPLRVRRLYSFI